MVSRCYVCLSVCLSVLGSSKGENSSSFVCVCAPLNIRVPPTPSIESQAPTTEGRAHRPPDTTHLHDPRRKRTTAATALAAAAVAAAAAARAITQCAHTHTCPPSTPHTSPLPPYYPPQPSYCCTLPPRVVCSTQAHPGAGGGPPERRKTGNLRHPLLVYLLIPRHHHHHQQSNVWGQTPRPSCGQITTASLIRRIICILRQHVRFLLSSHV